MEKITKVIINGALLFVLQNSAFAAHEEATGKSETDKLSRLENIIANLEERVGRLEKHTKPQANSTSHQEEKIDAKSGWKYRKSWMQLKVGMSANQVESTLGHPIRIDNMGSGFKKFFYWGELPEGAISGYIEIYEGKIYKIYIPEFHE